MSVSVGSRGPWGKAQFDGKVDHGVVPLPTAAGTPAARRRRSPTPEHRPVQLLHQPADGVGFLKFATNDENDLALLEVTGQFPTRERTSPELAADFLAEEPSSSRSRRRSRSPWTCRPSTGSPRRCRCSAMRGARTCSRDPVSSRPPSRRPPRPSMAFRLTLVGRSAHEHPRDWSAARRGKAAQPPRAAGAACSGSSARAPSDCC